MGDAASSLVVDEFKKTFTAGGGRIDRLDDMFMTAQNALLEKQKQLNATSKMKTTAVAACTDGKKLRIAHVGDSRVYVFSEGKVLYRTLDHSIPQMLVIAGEIKESEIRKHKDRSLILRVMGNEWEKPQYEIDKAFPLKKVQAVLLCSDGFWELIEDETMCEFLNKASSASEWLQLMRAEVEKNGRSTDMDNNSAIAVWCERKGKNAGN